MGLWLRATGRVVLYLLAVAALSGTLFGAGWLLLWAMTFHSTYFWTGLVAIGVVIGLGAMVKSEHDRLARDDTGRD